MKIAQFLIVAWAAVVPALSQAQSYPPAIKKRIDREMALNDACRGRGQSCESRDAAVAELKDFGWCYGHQGQIEAEKNWELCHDAGTASGGAAPAATAGDALSAPVEPDAVLSDTIKGNTKAINALVEMVRASDYRCDTISSARPWLTSRGYTLKCNRYSYTYEIADKGGHWIVTVD